MLKVTEKIVKQLSRTNLELEDRTALITALLSKLNTLPIGDMIAFTQNGLIVNGREMDMEAVIKFKEACGVLKDNFARKVIHEQIRYKAIEMGINKSISIDTLMFAKAALWTVNEYEILLEKLGN